MQLNREPRALGCLEVGFGAGDLGLGQFPAATFGEATEQDVPDGNDEDDGDQQAERGE